MEAAFGNCPSLSFKTKSALRGFDEKHRRGF